MNACAIRTLVGFDEAVTHTDIYTFVCRCSEIPFLTSLVSRTEGQSVGKSSLERHAPTVGAGEEIGEIKREIIALICRTRHPFAGQLFFGTHNGKSNPRVGAGHKLTKEFEVDAGGITAGFVSSAIHHPHTVDGIRNEAREGFVIGFGGETKRPSHHPEGIIGPYHKVNRPRRLDVGVKADLCHSVLHHRVAKFFIKWCLIIHTRGGAEGPAVVAGRNNAERRTRRDDGFAVPVPM